MAETNSPNVGAAISRAVRAMRDGTDVQVLKAVFGLAPIDPVDLHTAIARRLLSHVVDGQLRPPGGAPADLHGRLPDDALLGEAVEAVANGDADRVVQLGGGPDGALLLLLGSLARLES